MKKEIIVSAILFLIILSGVVYYFGIILNHDSDSSVSVFIPEETILALYSTDVRSDISKISKTKFINGIESSVVLNQLENEIVAIDSLLGIFPSQSKKLYENLILCVSKISVDESALLLIAKLSQDLEQDVFAGWLTDNVQNLEIKSRTSNGCEISTAYINSKELFSFSQRGKVILFSKKAFLVENALSTQISNDEEGFSAYVQRYLASGHQLFINYANLNTFLKQIGLRQGEGVFKIVESFSPYGAFKFQIGELSLDLNGVLGATHNVRPLQMLGTSIKSDLNAADVAPSQTAVFVSQAVGNFDSLWQKMTLDSIITKQTDTIKSILGINMEADILPLLDNEIAYGLFQPIDKYIRRNQFAMLKSNNVSDLIKRLSNASTSINKDSISFENVYRELKINRLAPTPLISMLTSSLLSGMRQPYYTELGGYVVFANDLGILHTITDEYMAGNVLKTTLQYSSAKESFSESYNSFYFINPARAYHLPLEYMNEEAKKWYGDNSDYFTSWEVAAWQLSKQKNVYFNQMHASISVQKKPEVDVLWKYVSQNPIVHGPYKASNFKDKSDEYLIVDNSNLLKLLSKGGKELWSYPLDTSLAGEIQMVDFYHNGKLQYFISTTKKAYLIDHNGKNVSGFPIEFPQKSTIGAVCFEIEREGFKFFVVSDKGNLYVYRHTGGVYLAWKLTDMDDAPSKPIQYFKKGNETYLLGQSAKGTVYVWRMNGREAIPPVKTESVTTNPYRMIFGTELINCSVVSTDQSGKLLKVKLNGEITNLDYGYWSGSNFVQHLDVNNDKSRDFLFNDNTKIEAYTDNGKRIFNFSVDQAINGKVIYESIKGQPILLYSTVNGKVNALFTDGSQVTGFPLKGSFPSLGLLEQKPVLVSLSDEHTLISYKLK